MLSAVDEFNEGIKSKLQDVTEASGFLTQDKTIYMFCLLMLFPLAYIYRKLPANPTLKVFIYILSTEVSILTLLEHIWYYIRSLSFIFCLRISDLPLHWYIHARIHHYPLFSAIVNSTNHLCLRDGIHCCFSLL